MVNYNQRKSSFKTKTISLIALCPAPICSVTKRCTQQVSDKTVQKERVQ